MNGNDNRNNRGQNTSRSRNHYPGNRSAQDQRASESRDPRLSQNRSYRETPGRAPGNGGVRQGAGGQHPARNNAATSSAGISGGANRPAGAVGGERRYDPRLIEEQRKRRREEQMRRSEEKRRNRRIRFRRFITVIVIYLLICIAAGAILFFSLRGIGERDKANRTYYFGEEEQTVTHTLALTPKGKCAVNFDELAEYCGMNISGDSHELRYITAEGEDVRFTVGTVFVSVNGNREIIEDISVLSEKGLTVPLSFVTDYMDGVTAEIADNGRTVKIDRMKNVDGTELPISFKVKSTPAISKEDEKNAEKAEQNGHGQTAAGEDDKPIFQNDLSAYEMYMNVKSDEYLLLVNSEHLLASDYIPPDLTDVVNTRSDRAAQQMREYAEKALEALYIELKSAGYDDVSVTSGYRSYATQKYLYDGYIAQEMTRKPSLTKEEAEEIVKTYSATPGTSEHQSGLCCDMHNLASADVSFAKQPAAKWLAENAHKFGFILRFPEDKTDITKISYEPWHFRFVGRYHATRIHESGMCLEEYIESLGKSAG